MTDTRLTTEEATEWTESLGQIMAGSWRQIALAQRLAVPEAMGLTTDQWVQEKLGGFVRLSIPERKEAVRELTASVDEGGQGMSQREAAEVLGVSVATVNRALDDEEPPVTNETPDTPTQAEQPDSCVTNETDHSEAADPVKLGLPAWAKPLDSDSPPPRPPYEPPVLDEATVAENARINNARSAARNLERDLSTAEELGLHLRTTPLDMLPLAYANGERRLTEDDVTRASDELERATAALEDIRRYIKEMEDA